MPLRIALCSLLLVGGLVPDAALHAQQVSLSPEIGLYVPTERLLEAADGSVGELEMGPSFGARLSLWFGRRVGASVAGSYVPTTFAFAPGGGPGESRDARLFNGSGQLVVFLLPRHRPLSAYLNGGVGVVSRGGVAFTDGAETTSLSGVFGGGVALRVGGMAFTLGADLFTYSAGYASPGIDADDLSQRDLLARLGLGIPLGGAGGAGSGPPPLP